MKYKLSMFQFDLPEKRIPNKPNTHRENAKLMILNRENGKIDHKKV